LRTVSMAARPRRSVQLGILKRSSLAWCVYSWHSPLLFDSASSLLFLPRQLLIIDSCFTVFSVTLRSSTATFLSLGVSC
jgi:hypothetical protein